MIVGVIVHYATHYPPGDHEASYVVVTAEAQMASCHSVMPTRTAIHEIYEI